MTAPTIPLQAAVTILDLPLATLPLTGAELQELVQGGFSVQAPISSIFSLLVGAPLIRLPPFNATINLTSSDIEVGIDTGGGPVTVNLPSAALWAAAFPGGLTGLDLCIVDINGNAANNAITPALNGADIFKYGAVVPVISANFGTLRLRPYGPIGGPVTGWYVRALNF
jgi:hypothetical protein